MLAVAFSAIRLLLPLATDYHAEIELTASESINKDVKIREIDTDWKWFRPRVKLIGIEIYNREDESLFANAQQLVLGVNLLSSLLRWELVVDDISLIGTDLYFSRDADGRFFVQGMFLNVARPQQANKNIELPVVILDRTIRVIDSTLEYRDEPLGLSYRLQDINVSVRLAEEKQNIYLNIDLPPELGDRLELGLELKGQPLDLFSATGQVFLRGMNINLPALLTKLGYQNYLDSGKLDIALWADLRSTHKRMLTGSLAFRELIVNLPPDRGIDHKWQVDSLSVDINSLLQESDLVLNVENMLLVVDGMPQRATGLNIQTRLAGSGLPEQGQLALDYFRIEHFYPLLHLFPDVKRKLSQAGIEEPRGDLDDLYIKWHKPETGEGDQSLFVRTKFSRLGLQSKNKIPSVAGLQGEIAVWNDQAELKLDTEAAVFDYPHYFRGPWELSRIKGDVRIKRAEGVVTIGARALEFNTSDINTRHWFDLYLKPEGSPFIDAYAVYDNGDAAAGYRYFPAAIINEKTLNWLDHAFVSGHVEQGDFELIGPLKKFPFRGGEGIFRVEFDVRDMVVNYYQDWPAAKKMNVHARFSGPGLFANVHHAQIYNSAIAAEQVSIDDFKKAVLRISADAYGDATDAARFIQNTELRKLFDPVIDQLAVEGSQATSMQLNIPLYKGPDRSFKLTTGLYDGVLDFTDWGLRFTDITTQADYGNEDINALPFSANLNGYPVVIAAETLRTPTASLANIHIDGEMNLNALLGKHEPVFLENTNGKSRFSADLNLGLRNPANASLRSSLRVRSNLTGIEIDLPEPFRKEASVPAKFALMAEFEKNKNIVATVNYDDWLRGISVFEISENRWQVQRANIRAQEGVPEMPGDTGIFVDGKLDYLDIDHWRDVLPGNDSGFLQSLGRVDMRVAELRYLQRTAEDVGISVTQQLHNWKIDLNAEKIAGEILIPKAGFNKRGLALNFKYLDVDALNENQGDEPASPLDLPPFQLTAKQMIVNDWRLNDVGLLVEPVSNGIRIHSLKVDDPALGLQGEGEWLLTDDGHHSTRMSLVFNSNNVGQGIASLGYAQIIKGGNGKAEFNVGWAAAPSAFSFDLLQGDAYMSIKEGQILEIEPGGGRLFGLLSLQTIPRRLALDFKDLFGKGFGFDKMKGNFTFTGGNAFTDDYYIDGPAGRIDIKGRTGLQARDYDQEILFRPDLSSSLPLIGTLLGGAPAGLAVIVADRIARVFGRQADDLARIQYTLTGSWDDPVIKPINNNATKGTSKASTKSETAVDQGATLYEQDNSQVQ